MSATMSTASCNRRQPSWICGVCADLAERAALPVLIPRVAFGVFLVLHASFACVLYVGLAWLLRPRAAARLRGFRPPPPASTQAAPGFSTSDFTTTHQRFRNLDERLSNLEAATVNSEAELRRAFRDLDRRR